MRKLYVLALTVCVIALVTLGFLAYASPFRGLQEGQLSLMAKTDKTEYSIGEDVKVSIYLVNNLDREVISRSKSYGLSVTGSKGVVLFCVSSETRVSPITVPPYTTYLIGEWVWNQRNADRNQVDVGTYVIRVNLLDAEARAEYGVDCVIEIK